MKKWHLIFILLSLVIQHSFSQGKFELQNTDSDKIYFQLIHNLIIIPVEVNGVKLSFILDTGVSKPIIFNFLNISEELHINEAEIIYLRGLGEGESVKALKSNNNIFKFGKAVNVNQDLFAVFDPALNFAPRLGVPIHGIIGYDILKDFVVEINYSKKFIKLYDPLNYNPKNCKNCDSLDLSFHTNKPYIECEVVINNNTIPVKLLIDTGGSDALWLFEDEENQITLLEKYFDDFLGRGLSGNVYGKRGKIDKFLIKNFELENINVAFPDSSSVSLAKKIKDRNGSLSGEILKRFNIIFDYKKSKITLRKNNKFNTPFYYNKSGITIEHSGVRVIKERDNDILVFGRKIDRSDQSSIVLSTSYKYSLATAFTIVELRDNSPAKKAGLELEDIILTVNGKESHLYSLQDIIEMFYGEEGKRINLLIDRNGIQMKFSFRLEDLL